MILWILLSVSSYSVLSSGLFGTVNQAVFTTTDGNLFYQDANNNTVLIDTSCRIVSNIHNQTVYYTQEATKHTDVIKKYSIDSDMITLVLKDLLKVSSLYVADLVIIYTELGDAKIQPNASISVYSVLTNKSRILKSFPAPSVPTSLDYDEKTSSILVAVTNENKHAIVNIDLLTMSTSFTEANSTIYGICHRNLNLYIKRESEILKYGTSESVFRVVESPILYITGSSLPLIEKISSVRNVTVITLLLSSTLSISENSSRIYYLSVGDAAPVPPPLIAGRFGGCDIPFSAAGDTRCICSYGTPQTNSSGSYLCQAMPSSFIILTQTQTLSVMPLVPSQSLLRLKIMEGDWYLKSVDYNDLQNVVYWVESRFTDPQTNNPKVESSRIKRYDVATGRTTTLRTSYGRHITTISINSRDDLLYWLDVSAGIIANMKATCLEEYCLHRTLVTSDILKNATHLIVVPAAGYMIYKIPEDEIMRRHLDGSNGKTILSPSLIKISSMAVHHGSEEVCISSSHQSSIVCLPLKGGKYKTIYKSGKHLYPISMSFTYDGDLVVVDDVYRCIYKISTSLLNSTAVNTTSTTSIQLAENLSGLTSIVGNQKVSETNCEKSGKNLCHHFCYSLPDTFRCECADGYKLSSVDNRTCQDPPVLYICSGEWIQVVKAFSVDHNNRIESIVYSENASIIALDYLFSKKHNKDYIFWINNATKAISRYSLRDNIEVMIVSKGLAYPRSVAVDWVSETLYWSDVALDTISLISFAGDVRKTMVENALQPYHIVVNPKLGKLYWLGWYMGNTILRCSSMLGSEVDTIIESMEGGVTDITIDPHTDRIVWVDAMNSLVVSVNANGRDKKIIVGTDWMRYPVAIAVWHNMVYWADYHMAAIYVAEGMNMDNVERVAGPLTFINDITLSHPDKQQQVGPCVNSPCGVCVPVSQTKFECICPNTQQRSLTNKHICVDIPKRVIGINTNPYLYSPDTEPLKLSNQQLHKADKITVHYQHQALYWTENAEESIKKVFINGTGFSKVYRGIFNVSDVKIDWLSGLILWTESNAKIIKCVTLNGKNHKVIHFTEFLPRFLLLDPPNSLLFWVECHNQTGFIYQSKISGKNKKQIVEQTVCPESCDIERQTKSLYWSCNDTIYLYKYDIEQLLQPRPLPVNTSQLLVIDDVLYILRNDTLSSLYTQGVESPDIRVDGATNIAALSRYELGYSKCFVDNGGCSHYCFHDGSSVECGCPDVYELLDNGKTCYHRERPCNHSNEFTCKSGECISRGHVCDYHVDCIDGSDEAKCGHCEGYGLFSCDNDTCLTLSHLCDGTVDCIHSKDDESPVWCSPCDKTGYKCNATGVCLPWSMKCDGEKHCLHGDDEGKCNKQEKKKCNSSEMECNDGECILDIWKCDGHKDCKEGEDEKSCKSCTSTDFDCGDGQCINSKNVCDRIPDCKNRKDELHCKGCGPGKRRCNDLSCRPSTDWCDHQYNCPDKSDELNCNYSVIDVASNGSYRSSHMKPLLVVILGSLIFMMCVLGALYKFKVLPRLKSSYKQLTRSSNKTMETNVCVTTNTYSEIETLSSNNENWRMKVLDATITSSVSSVLRPINPQMNPYERFGIAPVLSTTDVSVLDGPPPSVISGGYSSGPAPSSRSHAPSRAYSGRSRSLRSRDKHVSYHVINNWDTDHINSISDYDPTFPDNLSEVGNKNSPAQSEEEAEQII